MANRSSGLNTTPQLSQIRRWVGRSESWLKKFLKSLGSSHNILSVVAMGSAIRERGHRRSDFDLLVIYRDERPQLDAPLEVDVRMYPVEEIQEKVAQGHEVLGWAVKFGVPIFDREGTWHQLQASWRERVPLPSAGEAAERGHHSLIRAKEMLEADDEFAADDLVLSALTQFAREKLIEHGIFPASRPELPDQLRSIVADDALAGLLEDAMFNDSAAPDLILSLEMLLPHGCNK